METPSSSTRRVTRSQTLAAPNNNNIPTSRKIEDSENGVSKSRQRTTKQQQDRSALIDITNDSPIVGLATGGLETPSSAMTKRRTIRAKSSTSTPGSGEALLRCQVKTLLQKVEEEAELSKLSLENRPFLNLQGFVNSPMRLLAPTPANTPQVLNLSEDEGLPNHGGLPSMNTSSVIQEQLISQVVSYIFEGKMQESIQSEKSMITRSLLLDFSEKSETLASLECSSVVTTDRGKSDRNEKSYPDDDNSSVWSIQVNASSIQDENEDDDGIVAGEVEEYCDDNYEENAAEEYNDVLLDELCEGMSRISMNNDKITAKFSGRHTTFLYNSDDEIVEERTENNNNDSASGIPPSVLCFKGLPTPKGKHLRFASEEEETDD